MTRNASAVAVALPTSPPTSNNMPPSIRFVPHHDPRSHRPSLPFPSITRTLPSSDAVIRVGRYSERDNVVEPGPNTPSLAPVGFKSKVVSRRHCVFWCSNNQWFIRDVKSSSGTFLNHLRLSPPGAESKPWPINDGDVVQLGIDFKGGEEMIFRCVKIRVEINRGWQKSVNPFNKSTHKRLRKLALNKKRDSDSTSLNSTDCTICLMSISPCQSLFVAPCSHVWHYKCIRPILQGHAAPLLTCPNCRATHDLEADIEEGDESWEDDDNDDDIELKNVIEASKNDTTAQLAIHTLPDREGDSPMVGASSNNLAPRLAPSPSTRENSLLPAGNNILATPPRNIATNLSPNSRFELASTFNGLVSPNNEGGPQTPRNDIGPFVLDGGAGRGAGISGAGAEAHQ